MYSITPIFKRRDNVQLITPQEFADFETLIGFTLPVDYRQHMLTYNGGIATQSDMAHKNFPLEGGGGIAYFNAIKYGSCTMEYLNVPLTGYPSGHINIGVAQGGGDFLMDLNSDTYGAIKWWFPDEDIEELSPSFTDLLNDMIEIDFGY
ncbi:MAG: SMI1/KNR4 family protein [Nonlabens sp.]